MAFSKNDIEAWLLSRLAVELGMDRDQIDVRKPFAWYGLASVALVSISGELETYLGRKIPSTRAFEHPTIELLAAHLAGEGVAPSFITDRPTAMSGDEPVAIVGIGCRFPGAHGPAAFWSRLRDGQDDIGPVPAGRWSVDEFYDPDPSAPGKLNAKGGGFLDRIDGFDAFFFGISPAEATSMDPQQRLLLQTAWEALEDAGQPIDRLAGSRTGIFLGISVNEYGARFEDPALVDARSATGNALSIAANRISYAFDFHGPSMAIDTACSSSLVAVHLACNSLRCGESTLVVAGGVNLVLSPRLGVSFTKAGILSPDGRCHTFDQRANGYVRGEGVGMVVLKPLSRALEDGDPIYAVVRGSAVNQDGRSNGLMAPNPAAQEAVLRAAYEQANVSPSEVQYVEAHGTGTLLGDAIEMRALGAVVGAGRAPGNACAVGSVKTNIGHLEAAAGVAGLIKVALCLRHGSIPKVLHFREPNREIPFEALGLRVQAELTTWPSAHGRRLAGVSSFGFGGTNAHVVLEGVTPTSASPEKGQSGPHVLPVSARDSHSLEALAASYRDYLDNEGATTALGDICFTASARRSHHERRLCAVGRSRRDLVLQLEAFVRGNAREGLAEGAGRTPPSVVFVFSGQGAQWSGMGRNLIEEEPVFRRTIERCEEAYARHASGSLAKELCLLAEDSRLAKTEIAQPAIFAVQLALAELWRSWGIRPDAVVGHSVGEIAAAVIAGAISLEDGMLIASRRGSLMEQTAGRGKMLAVALAPAAAELLVASYNGRANVAAVNGPDTVVLSGDGEAIDAIAEKLALGGTFAKLVPVNYAFHSAQMDSIMDDLLAALSEIAPRASTIPIVSTVTGRPIDGREMTASYWVRGAREPVRFADAVGGLVDEKERVFLEIGGRPVLARAMTEIAKSRGAKVTVLASMRDTEASLLPRASLGALYALGATIDWAGVAAPGGRCVSLPSYAWHEDRYWTDTTSAASSPRRVSHEGARPLLGAHVEPANAPGSHLWETTFDSPQMAYLLHHRVRGAAVFPAAAYVEAMLEAADAIGLSLPWVVRDVAFDGLLLLDSPGGMLQVTAAPEGNDMTIAVHSRRTNGANGANGARLAAWSQHAKATLAADVSGYSSASRVMEVAAIQARCLERIAPAALYQSMLERGLEYGGPFRGIGEIWRREGEALGRISLPTTATAGHGNHVAHPALLDACLQLLAAAQSDASVDERDLFLPRSIPSVVLFEPAGASVWAHVEVRRVGPGADEIEAELRLANEAGLPIMHLAKVRLHRVPAVAKRDDTNQDSWFYRIEWRQRDLQASDALPKPGRWVVFADAAGVGEALARIFEARGDDCLLVGHGDGASLAYHTVAYHTVIDAKDPAAIRRLIAGLSSPGQPPLRGAIHLWSLDAAPVDNTTQESLAYAEHLACSSALTLAQALTLAGLADTPRLALVTRGAQAVRAGDSVAVAQSLVWGLAKAIAFELPELQCACIDLDPTVGLVADADRLARQILSPDEENQAAFRGGRRFVPRLAPHVPEELVRGVCPNRSAPPPFAREDGTYLVTGGAGGLGLAAAKRLVARGARSLLLVGRNAPRGGAEAAIAHMREAGANVVFAQADVADRRALDAVLSKAREKLPPLRGVLHAAGTLEDGALLELETSSLARVLAPKVRGAWNVHTSTLGDSLDWFVLFSSAVSVLGSPGQGNYAAANTFLDALVHERRARGLPAHGINWGPWAEVGLAAELKERLDQERELTAHLVKMLPVDHGLDLLELLLRDDGAQTMVLPYDVRNLLQFYPEGGQIAMFAEVLREELQPLKIGNASHRLHERPQLAQPYVAPRNEMESIIAGIWQRALGIDKVGVHDNFFELGGDSVFAAQTVVQINKRFGVNASLQSAFAVLTVEKLALMMQEHLLAKVESLSDQEAEQLLSTFGD